MSNKSLTQIIGFNGLTHRDIPFVDIIPSTDIRLFIDPVLIEGSDVPLIVECKNIMLDFFRSVVEACKTNDYERLRKLLLFGKEKNATHLGMSKFSSTGKGASEEILQRVFRTLAKAYNRAADTPPHPSALNVMIENFGEDRMSDLLTNILLKQLYVFTDSQKDRYMLPQADKPKVIGQYWDSVTHSWIQLNVKPFIVDGEEIILVPKGIVRKTYVCSVSKYLRYRFIPHRQRYHLINRTVLTRIKYNKKVGQYVEAPSKKAIYDHEIVGRNRKEIAMGHLDIDPDSLVSLVEEFIADVKTGKYTMTDSELDCVIAEKMRKIS